MEWLSRLNQSVDYIEEHLDHEIRFERAAQIAGCSTFHYQRIFSYLADIPLSEYIRRRRLTQAALKLQSGAKVIDVSFKYGYDSPTAFSRAFKNLHGIAPSGARKMGAPLKAYPRISFNLSIKGAAQMNYRIEKKEPFRIVGMKEHYCMNIEENFTKIPLMWQKAIQSGATIPTLCGLMDKEPFGMLGVSACMNGKDFDYYIAVSSSKDTPQGMSEFFVPAAIWAIFECIGPMPKAIQELQKRIVSEWLPTSGYELANAPDIEVYPEGNQMSEDYRCEVWLPVKKE